MRRILRVRLGLIAGSHWRRLDSLCQLRKERVEADPGKKVPLSFVNIREFVRLRGQFLRLHSQVLYRGTEIAKRQKASGAYRIDQTSAPETRRQGPRFAPT